MEEIEIKDFEHAPDIITRRLEMEEKKFNAVWSCCCGDTDARLLAFICTMIMLAGLMLFCMAQLMLSDSCEHQQTYTGLLSVLIGIIIPNPKLNKRH